MQPINYGMSQPYPQQGYALYPNCFDQLTTHGVIADDAMEYITGTPSPYLHNYVAQRGWAPSMPGQMMPEPLPNMQPPQKLPRNNVYNVPGANQDSFVKKDKYETAKKVALAALVVGLGVFAAVKGKKAINWIKTKFRSNPPAPPTQPPTPPQTPPAPATGNWLKRTWTNIKNYFS